MLVSKECSCTELTKSYLDEIEKADGELNAYVNVTGEEALKTAEAVETGKLPPARKSVCSRVFR